MSVNTQLAVRSARLSHWAELLSQKAAGNMNVSDFCNANGITRNQYFYWLRRLREAAIEGSGCTFAELVPPKDRGSDSVITISVDNMNISVGSSISEEHLTMVLRAVKNA